MQKALLKRFLANKALTLFEKVRTGRDFFEEGIGINTLVPLYAQIIVLRRLGIVLGGNKSRLRNEYGTLCPVPPLKALTLFEKVRVKI